MKRRFRVVCEWIDSQDNHVLDADEIQVSAESAAQAISAAKRQWRLTIGAVWPSCRLEKVWVVTPTRQESLA